MSKKIGNYILPILFVCTFILTVTILSVKICNAAVALTACSKNWECTNNKLNASIDDTYPYNSDTATISGVSMDVLYGTSKNLVYYHGEFPYEQLHDDDGNVEEGWEGYYTEDDTDAAGYNPSFGASATVDQYDYWGSDVEEDWFANVPTCEQVNAGDIKSLRLYASTMTKTGISVWFNNVLYVIAKFFAWLASIIIGLLVDVKNISMDSILEILHLDDLGNLVTQNFIYDSEHLKLSAFTGFCIIMLIFAITAYAIRYARGKDQVNGLWSILSTVILGAILVGVSLTGNITSLGSSISSFTSELLYSTVEALSTDGTGSAFVIDIDDSENENKIVQMSEMAMINKAFIDMQICAQFGVSDIDDLTFSNLGDSNNTNAKSYLSGIDSADLTDDFNDNLGYYYWFANSSAVEKTSLNTTFPDTDTQAINDKLSSMMTYLQVQYNANSSDSAVTKRIKDITLSFANPDGGGRFICLLLFSVALTMTALVLFKYGFNVVVAKIQMFIALIGLILAGPLIISANKKLVNAGKAILGMLLVSFLEITIYSLVFDIIIYGISIMFSPNILSILAVIALLRVLLYFNASIAQYLKRLLERTEQRISPSFVTSRRAAKQWAKGKAREKINQYDDSYRTVGYDRNGEAITEKRKGDVLSKLMHSGANSIFNEGNEHQGLFTMTKKLNSDRLSNKANTDKNIRENAELAIEERRNAMYAEANRNAKDVENEVEEALKAAKLNKDEYNESLLSDAEKKLLADRQSHIDEMNELINNGDYQDILKRKAEMDIYNAKLKEGETKQELSAEDSQRLASYNMKIKAKDKQIELEQNKIDDAIKERAAKDSLAKRGMTLEGAEGNSLEEKIKNVTKNDSVARNKNELEAIIQKSIDDMDNEVNKTSRAGKIGRKSNSTINKEAATAQAAAMLQLQQLQQGQDVMTADEAKTAIQDIVDNVSIHYDGDAQSADMHVREAMMHQIDTATTTEQVKAARTAYNQTIDRQNAAYKERNQEVKSQYKNAKSDAGKHVRRATVREQLESAVKQQFKPDMSEVINSTTAEVQTTTSSVSSLPLPPPQGPDDRHTHGYQEITGNDYTDFWNDKKLD